MSGTPNVRNVLFKQAKALPSERVAVLLSAGIDSASVLFALLEAGKQVTAYSFALAGWASSDFMGAMRIAKTFGVPFTPVRLPTDTATLQRDCLRLAREFSCSRKTQFECFWPMLYAYAATTESVVASGMGADGHFCISKKGMIHYRDRIDDFRRSLYADENYAQRPQHEKIAASLDKTCWLPYLSEDMRSEFLGTTWDQVNRPKQKQSILAAFPERFTRMRVRPHINLQLGDSRIAEHFETLLRSSWGITLNYPASIVSVYNALARGELSPCVS